MGTYILVHGLMQSPSSWDKTVTLMSQELQVMLPELSLGLVDSYEGLYRHFSDYCNDTSDSLNLCGLSLGAILALHYTIDNPERVQSLVLIGSQYKMPKVLLGLQSILFRIIPEKLFIADGFQKKNVVRLINSMKGLDFSEEIKNISCDTLIVCGENDIANKSAAVKLAGHIPKSEIKFVRSTGHEINTEAPEKLAPLLEAFWLTN